jgi:hypothetical protein
MSDTQQCTLSTIEQVGIDISFRLIDMGHIASPALSGCKNKMVIHKVLITHTLICYQSGWFCKFSKRNQSFSSDTLGLLNVYVFSPRHWIAFLSQHTHNRLICGAIGM